MESEIAPIWDNSRHGNDSNEFGGRQITGEKLIVILIILVNIRISRFLLSL